MTSPQALTDVLGALDEFKSHHKAELESAHVRMDKLEVILNRPFASFNRSATNDKADHPRPERWLDTKTMTPIPVLTSADLMGDTVAARNDEPDMPLGRVLRGIILGGRAADHKQLSDNFKAMSIASDPSGGYTVGGRVATDWIDRLRSQMVLTRAGCRTVPMPAGELQIARVLSDPTVHWRTEGQDLSDSQPTLGAVTLRAKTVAVLVKFSIELAQDSANIEDLLAGTLTSAMAHAIDSAGLVGVATNASAAPGGLFDLQDRNTVTGIGSPSNWDWVVDGAYELALDNVPLNEIGALVAHPAVWKKMRKLKSGIANDNTSLTMPDEVARLPKLWTTAAPLDGSTAKAVIGRWPDLLMGVRQYITLKVLTERFVADTLEVGMLAWARVDFAATRPASFCTLEGITV